MAIDISHGSSITPHRPSPLRSDAPPAPSFFGLMCDGGYQEAVAAPSSALVKVPSSLPWSAYEAAPAVSTFGTVHHGVVTRAGLCAGETVLVTGATGGVGSAAVRLALRLGCRVVAVTSSGAKAPALRALAGSDGDGALDVLVAPAGDFHRDAALAGGGADVAVECVGSPTFQSSLKSLKPGGRLVLFGSPVDSLPSGPPQRHFYDFFYERCSTKQSSAK